METVGATAPVFCLRAQGRRKAAKGPSLKDRSRCDQETVRWQRNSGRGNLARTKQGMPVKSRFSGTELPFFRTWKPDQPPAESHLAACKIPNGRTSRPAKMRPVRRSSLRS